MRWGAVRNSRAIAQSHVNNTLCARDWGSEKLGDSSNAMQGRTFAV